MDIETLLQCSATELEAMSDDQLLEHFKKYLDVTRPERVVERQARKQTELAVYIPPAKQAALKLLEASGVDLSFMRYRKKK